jgi:hypothetical protein
MCMYIVYMTTYRLYTHNLPKFEPKNLMEALSYTTISL